MMKNSENSDKKILMIAFIGSENLGDEAIFESLLSIIKKNVSEDITAISVNPSKTKKEYNVRSVKNSIPNIFREIKRADVITIGGGGILQDETSLYNLPYYAIQMIIAQIFGKKTMYIGVGVGPITSMIGKLLFSLSLKKIDLVTVRDTKSLSLVQKFGPKDINLKLVADPAVSITPEDKDISEFIPGNIMKDGFVAVSVRQWDFHNRFIPVSIMHKINKILGRKKRKSDLNKKIAELLDKIIEKHNKTIVFTPLFGDRDILASNEVRKLMKNKNNVFIIKKTLKPKDLSTILSRAESLVGMRLHSVILAASVNTPTIALSYSSKVRYFMKHAGMEDYVVDTDNFEVDSVYEKFENLDKNLGKISKELENSIKYLRQKHDENIMLLKELVS